MFSLSGHNPGLIVKLLLHTINGDYILFILLLLLLYSVFLLYCIPLNLYNIINNYIGNLKEISKIN